MSDPGGTNIESYSYLGLSTIVRKIRPGSVLTLVKAYGATNGDAGDVYTGLDRFGNVVDQRWVTSDSSNGTSGDTLGTTTERFQYGYDQNGNVLYRQNGVNSSFSELYHANGAGELTAYDPLNRLTGFRRGTLSASGSNGTTLDTVTTASATNRWSLDALGNSTNTGGTPRTFNSKNQIASYGGTSGSVQYDHNGNMTQDANGGNFSYDAWNRLIDAYEPNSPIDPNNLGEEYTYDADGRRPSLWICNGNNNTVNSYYSVSGQELEDDVSVTDYSTCPPTTVTTTDTYVWSISYINDLVERDHSVSNVNGGAATRIYAQQDANHDVTSLVNTSGTVLERFVYDPYGVATVLSASWSSTSDAYGWSYTFQGGQLDPVTGFIHFAARELNPYLGVWMQQDPAGYVDGVDRYQFVLSNPIDGVDPEGLATVYVWHPAGGEAGHSSMDLCDPGQTHVSWWPSGSVLRSPGFAVPNLKTDRRLEGRPPDATIDIPCNCFNETAMAKWWSTFVASGDVYSDYNQNCAWAVKAALNEAVPFSNPVYQSLLHTHYVAWTPADVENYANDLKDWCKAKSKGTWCTIKRDATLAGQSMIQAPFDNLANLYRKLRCVIGY